MTDKIARVWNGSEWVSVSSPVGVPSSIAVYQSTPPTTPVAGQFWINSDEPEGYFVQSNITEIEFLTGVTSSIQEQLDSKEKMIPLQTTAPTSPSTSDLWVDNTDPLKPMLKVYNGTSWVVAGSSISADDDQLIIASRMFG